MTCNQSTTWKTKLGLWLSDDPAVMDPRMRSVWFFRSTGPAGKDIEYLMVYYPYASAKVTVVAQTTKPSEFHSEAGAAAVALVASVTRSNPRG